MTSRFYLVCALALLIVAPMLSARAYPTLYGDGGLVLAPTADVLPFTHFDLAADFIRFTGADGDDSTAIPVRLDYGIANGIELFASYATPTTTSAFQEFGIGLKILLAAENTERHLPAIAFGARYNRVEDVFAEDRLNGYAVVSSRLLSYGDEELGTGFILRGHVGAEYTRFGRPETSATFASLFGGVSYEVRNGIAFVVDYLPDLQDEGITYRRSSLSAALRIPVSDTFILQAGGTRPFATGDSTVMFGVDYHYGPKDIVPDRVPTIMY